MHERCGTMSPAIGLLALRVTCLPVRDQAIIHNAGDFFLCSLWVNPPAFHCRLRLDTAYDVFDLYRKKSRLLAIMLLSFSKTFDNSTIFPLQYQFSK